MKRIRPIENQEYLTFNDEDVIILEKIQNMPENGAYYSEYVFMIMCTKGRVEMTYDGKRLTLHEDELFLGVPGAVLSDYMLSPNFDCKILALKPSEAVLPLAVQKQMVHSAIYIKENPVVKLHDEDLVTYFNYYNFICDRIRKPSYRYFNGEVRTLLNAFFLFVVGLLDNDMQQNDMPTTIHGEHLVDEFVKLVNDDGGHHRAVEYYADKLNISAKYLSTIVRSTIDRTPTEIIKIVTMKEIERRLRYSNDSIKEISNALNFPNTSFFGKYFKQHSGMTPNSYRKKYHH